MLIFKKIVNFITKPQVALFIIILSIIGHIILISRLGGFTSNNFLAFGPSKDKHGNYSTFAGLELNNWNKIIAVYFIILFSSILNVYYTNVVSKGVQLSILNSAVKVVPYSKFWSYVVLFTDPSIQIILYIIKFLAAATLQIQFIFPELLGTYISNIPFIIRWLTNKNFIYS